MKSLKNYHSLQNISLTFLAFLAIDQELIRPLQKVTSLRSIHIVFRLCFVSGYELLRLSEGLEELVFLKFLTLDFYEKRKMVGEGAIKTLKYLKELLPSTVMTVSEYMSSRDEIYKLRRLRDDD